MGLRNMFKQFMGMSDEQIRLTQDNSYPSAHEQSVEDLFSEINEETAQSINRISKGVKPKKQVNNVQTPLDEEIKKEPIKQKPDSSFIIYRPKDYDEAPDIAQRLKCGQSLVLNLNSLESEKAIRVIDFIYGVVFGLGGDMRQLGHNLFVCVPSGIDINEIGILK